MVESKNHYMQKKTLNTFGRRCPYIFPPSKKLECWIIVDAGILLSLIVLCGASIIRPISFIALEIVPCGPCINEKSAVPPNSTF
jgi:hypothetical protein